MNLKSPGPVLSPSNQDTVASMAELVGGAFLSSLLSVLFDQMASRPVVHFISGKKNNNELLMRELKIKLLTANKLVDDAEEKQMTSPTVRKWLDDLKNEIYCVGEMLDEINTEALRRQLEGEDDHSPAASSSTSWITRSVFKSSSPSASATQVMTEPAKVQEKLQLDATWITSRVAPFLNFVSCKRIRLLKLGFGRLTSSTRRK